MDIRLWAAAQAVLGVLMAMTIFYTVTGFILWLAANVAAGIAGLIAAGSWRDPVRAARVSMLAAGLFGPMNIVFGLTGLLVAGFDPVPMALVVIAMVQIGLAWSVRAGAPQQTTQPAGQSP